MEILGLALTAHPLALLRPRAGALGCVPIAEALLARASRVRVAGLVAATRRTPTRSGQTMQFVTLEDETGLLEGTLFPGAYRRLGDRLSNLGPYVVEGDLEERWRAQSLNIRTLERLPDLC
jgi:DNA polymerase III alpha subunit